MKIVIFDDDRSDRTKLRQYIMSWCNRHGYNDIIISEYSSADKLDFELPEIMYSDLFFLDIMTPDSTNAGFRVAEKIHLINPSANIVFTTSSPDHWSNAFDISALHYLMKPIRSEKVYKLLDRVYSSPSKRSISATIVNGNEQKEIIEYDKVLFVEAMTSSHSAIIHLTNGQTIPLHLSGSTFSSLIERYFSPNFVQCHKSFIVNSNYVEQYFSGALKLRNLDIEIPIGRKYRSMLLDKLIERKKEGY